MGEVYRADDLKLGQPVALKFLPPKLAEDPVRRERFFAEVRITRQLSHPNICRVYDIGDVDGLYFLSMEYIDGEDLASLTKRIGHLTNEKALDIARQLVSGLAAAHERGVLHRDLKPANIMLDGHGRVRITDFGLAIAVEDESQASEIAGTPAYMAPEQLAGKGATVRSDMYSLGMVLYEIYTGKKAFTAMTLAELREQKETYTPRAPSEIRPGIDSVVERLIQRCMERDPNARPSSVAQLALALPGGDPLAAAIAAGETPSPEMVAASGSKEGLRPVVAWGLLAFIILGTLGIIAMQDRFRLPRRIPFKKEPAVLVERSQEIIRKVRYSETHADSACGFIRNEQLLNYIRESDKTVNRWKKLDSRAILFWYRQSPSPMNAPYYPDFWAVTIDGPPLTSPGEILIILDTEGHLMSFRAVPVQNRSSTAPQPDWNVLFAEAGLDSSQWTPAEPQSMPPVYADSVIAWQGSFSNRPYNSVRIEAAAIQGKPVRFDVIDPWLEARTPSSIATTFNIAGILLILVGFTVAGLLFARRNLRLGRGDRRSALRLALSLGVLVAIWIILSAHHVSTFWEVRRILLTVGFSLFFAGTFWHLFMAFEPFVRRQWPRILVSWTRLMSGDWKDSLFARDVLIGCAFGTFAIAILILAYIIIPSVLGYVEPDVPRSFELNAAMGIHYYFASIVSGIHSGIVFPLGCIALLFFLRILLRSQIAALIVSAILATPVIGFANIRGFAVALAVCALVYLVLMRFGLVAAMVCFGYYVLLDALPGTLDTSAWYKPYGFFSIALLISIALFAFRFSLGSRPILAPSRLDD
jgi:serine/threonine-protein kinase